MLTFKNQIKFLGYSAALLLFLFLGLIFFDMVSKQISINSKIIKIDNKEEAEAVDIWRISYNGGKRYRLKAISMDKKKNGLIVLHNAKLWYFEISKPVIYLKSDKAVMYKNNNIYATGNVFLKRGNLKLYAKSVFWNDKLKVARSDNSFRGTTKKSSFRGKNFVYYQSIDELVINGANIWLK